MRRTFRPRVRRALAAGILGAVFSPAGIAGLSFWLKAPDTSTLWQESTFTTPAGNGDVVGGWQDKSGLSNNATQTVTADKPTRQDNSINGLPTVKFDGTDDDLDISVPLTNETIFVVCRNLVPAQTGTVIAQSGNFRMTYPTIGQMQYVHNGTLISVSSFTSSDANIFCAIQDGTNMSLSANNGTPVTSAVTPAAHTYTRLGSRGSQFLNGDIAEIIIYNSALSAANVALVKNYLSGIYGIALS
jgi:hypothetical protein